MIKKEIITVDEAMIAETKKLALAKGKNEFDELSYERLDSKWIIFKTNSMYYQREFEVLSSFPFLHKNVLLNKLFHGEDQNEIIAAAFLLTHLEKTRYLEFRHDVIESLEGLKMYKLAKIELLRIEAIIYILEMRNGYNRRQIIGKKNQEIESDAAFFEDIALRAFTIINKIKWIKRLKFFIFR